MLSTTQTKSEIESDYVHPSDVLCVYVHIPYIVSMEAIIAW